MEIIVLVVLFALPCGFMCASLAKEKGYTDDSAFVIGLLFSVPALIYFAGLPDRSQSKREDPRPRSKSQPTWMQDKADRPARVSDGRIPGIVLEE